MMIPADDDLRERVARYHRALWRIEAGPEHAAARDHLRHWYFVAYRMWVDERTKP